MSFFCKGYCRTFAMLETIQAKLVLASTLLILLMNVIFSYQLEGKFTGTMVLVVVLILGVPLALLFAYDINCLVKGNCTIWSWIRTFFYLFSVLLTVLAMILIAMERMKPKKPVEEKKPEEKKP